MIKNQEQISKEQISIADMESICEMTIHELETLSQLFVDFEIDTLFAECVLRETCFRHRGYNRL